MKPYPTAPAHDYPDQDSPWVYDSTCGCPMCLGAEDEMIAAGTFASEAEFWDDQEPPLEDDLDDLTWAA